MNKLKLLVFLLTSLTTSSLVGQNVPQGISYQAIARDADGSIFENTEINVTIGILNTSLLVWEEIHTVSTNQFGLISLIIGEGVSTAEGSLNNFDEILWFDDTYFAQIGIEVDGGDLIDLGNTQFLTVPYAFHAQTVENIDDADADPTNEIITDFTLVANTLTIQEGGAQFQVDLSSFSQVDDADANPTNELITDVTLDNNDMLTIEEGGAQFQVDLSLLSQDEDWEVNGNTVFNDTGSVGIGTNSPTSNFHADASVSYNILTIDENNNGLTLSDIHHVVIANVTNANMTINLPDAGSCEGREYVIKSYSTGGGNELTVTAQIGQVIDLFDNTLDLNGNSMDAVTLISDGSNWWILSNN